MLHPIYTLVHEYGHLNPHHSSYDADVIAIEDTIKNIIADIELYPGNKYNMLAATSLVLGYSQGYSLRRAAKLIHRWSRLSTFNSIYEGTRFADKLGFDNLAIGIASEFSYKQLAAHRDIQAMSSKAKGEASNSMNTLIQIVKQSQMQIDRLLSIVEAQHGL